MVIRSSHTEILGGISSSHSSHHVTRQCNQFFALNLAFFYNISAASVEGALRSSSCKKEFRKNQQKNSCKKEVQTETSGNFLLHLLWECHKKEYIN